MNWEADFDVAGVWENAVQLIQAKAEPMGSSRGQSQLAGSGEHLISKYLECRFVGQEGASKSTFVDLPMRPTTWAIVDRTAVSPSRNSRGYAIALTHWARRASP